MKDTEEKKDFSEMKNVTDGNIRDFNLDDFLKIDPSEEDVALINAIGDLQAVQEKLDLESGKIGKEITKLKAGLELSLITKKIHELKIGELEVKMVPYQNFSISRKGDSPETKQRNILELEPWLIQYGLGDKVTHDAVSIHHQTLKSVLTELHKSKKDGGEFGLDIEETLKMFPFMKHHAGMTVQIKKIK